jgi:hypothetical protein
MNAGDQGTRSWVSFDSIAEVWPSPRVLTIQDRQSRSSTPLRSGRDEEADENLLFGLRSNS